MTRQLHDMSAFGHDIWNCLKEYSEDLLMDDPDERLITIAAKHGLVKQVIYDPLKHGEGIEADPGCEIWYWGDEK